MPAMNLPFHVILIKHKTGRQWRVQSSRGTQAEEWVELSASIFIVIYGEEVRDEKT
jgi:hypothetical protein